MSLEAHRNSLQKFVEHKANWEKYLFVYDREEYLK